MVEIHRTCRIKLDVSDDGQELLHQTNGLFQYCANRTADWAWRDDDYCVTSEGKADDALYDDLRSETDNLHSNLIQKAIKRGVKAVDSGVERMKNGDKASQPNFTSWSIVYDKRSATFKDDYATLATPDGRVKCEYVTPDNPDKTPFSTYYQNDEYSINGATLQYDELDNEFFLHVNLCKERDETTNQRSDGSKNGTVLGVDLNVTGSFAVTSTGEFIGNSDYLNHKRDEYERRRAKLQQNGGHNAHNTIQRIGKRFSNWSDEWLHNRANELVAHAKHKDVDAIVFEDLEQIRNRMSNDKKFQQWAFNHFSTLVTYKAKAEGIAVKEIQPAYTSQRCNKCGHIEDANRNGKAFNCQKCDYTSNADYNAAKNIARRFCKNVQQGQKSLAGRVSCQYALKSGTLTVNGDFSPSTSCGQNDSPPTSQPL